MKIYEAQNIEREAIDSFYKSTEYSGSWSKNERAFYIKNNNVIVAAVKVEEIEGIFTLRGMFVSSQLQKSGYGSLLLKHIEQTYINKTLFCLPFSHLESFYGKVGFRKIPRNQLPDVLKKRASKYLTEGHDVIAMKQ